jgi:uncharacterized protein
VPDGTATKQLPPQAAHFAEVLRAHLPQLRERYAVERLALFGSYIHGEQRNGSDLDVLASFSRTPSLFDLVGIQDDLTDLLDVKVDLVMKDSLRPRIGRIILREAVPV